MNKIMKYASLDAMGTATYVVLVAIFFFLMEQRFSGKPDNGVIIIPIAMLMLLVFSVALVGTLIFGRPVMWYLDGKKKEALSLLGHTLGILSVVLIIAFVILMMVM